jgi:hypothetical protein
MISQPLFNFLGQSWGSQRIAGDQPQEKKSQGNENKNGYDCDEKTICDVSEHDAAKIGSPLMTGAAGRAPSRPRSHLVHDVGVVIVDGRLERRKNNALHARLHGYRASHMK